LKKWEEPGGPVEWVKNRKTTENAVQTYEEDRKMKRHP